MKKEQFNPNIIKVYKYGNNENDALFKEKCYSTPGKAQGMLNREIKRNEGAYDYNEKFIATFKAESEKCDIELEDFYKEHIDRAIALNKSVKEELDYLYACKVYEFRYALFEGTEVKN